MSDIKDVFSSLSQGQQKNLSKSEVMYFYDNGALSNLDIPFERATNEFFNSIFKHFILELKNNPRKTKRMYPNLIAYVKTIQSNQIETNAGNGDTPKETDRGEPPKKKLKLDAVADYSISFDSLPVELLSEIASFLDSLSVLGSTKDFLYMYQNNYWVWSGITFNDKSYLIRHLILNLGTELTNKDIKNIFPRVYRLALLDLWSRYSPNDLDKIFQRIILLRNLKHLEIELKLDQDQLLILDKLRSFEKLESLNLILKCSHDETINNFNIIYGFENLIKLKKLSVRNTYNYYSANKVNNHIMKSLNRLINLNMLNFSDTDLERIYGLDNLKNLRMLYLNNNKITKIEGLENLKTLKTLNLNFNSITKIEGLSTLTNLKGLGLRVNKITQIEGFSTLTNLKELDLYYNKLTKIEGLDNLRNLRDLNLTGNKITKIEGLDNLRNLKDLNLTGNKITKIEGLDNLRNLKELNLDFNQITKIEGLSTLTNINRLYLPRNQITKIEGLNSLTNLKRLSLIYNHIRYYHPNTRIPNNNMEIVYSLRRLNIYVEISERYYQYT